MAVLGGDADLAGRARGHAEADLEGHADRVPARLGSVRAVVLGGADHADVAGAAGAVAPAAAARGPVALRARDRIGIGAARRAVEDVEGDRRVVVAEAEAGHRADPLVEVAGVDAVVLDRQLHAVAPVRAGVVVEVAPGLEVAGGVERVQRQGRRSERPAAEPAAERGRIVRRRGRDREDCAQRDGRDDRDQPDALDDAAVGPERRPHSAWLEVESPRHHCPSTSRRIRVAHRALRLSGRARHPAKRSSRPPSRGAGRERERRNGAARQPRRSSRVPEVGSRCAAARRHGTER